MSDPQSNGTGPPGPARQAVFVAEREVRDLAEPGPRRVHDRGSGRAGRRGSLDGHEAAQVARQGALDALAASRPGVRAGARPDPELAAARAEIARLSEALKEMGVRLMLAEGKGRWD